MNRFDYRVPRSRRSATLAGLAASAVIGAVALSGCSAGQLSQTAMQQSAVDGNQAVIKNVALRNVRIQALQTSSPLGTSGTLATGTIVNAGGTLDVQAVQTEVVQLSGVGAGLGAGTAGALVASTGTGWTATVTAPQSTSASSPAPARASSGAATATVWTTDSGRPL